MSDDRRCHCCGHRVELISGESEATFGYRPRRDPDAVETLIARVRATWLRSGQELQDAWAGVAEAERAFGLADDMPPTGAP